MIIDCPTPIEPRVHAITIFFSIIEARENGGKESLGETFPGTLSWG